MKAEDFSGCFDPAMSLTFDPNIELSDDEKEALKNISPRARLLESGDVIFICSRDPVKIGEQYQDYPAFVSRIICEPKKWWQFWKRKKQIGYEVTWK